MAAASNKKDIQVAELALNGVLFSLLGFVMLCALNLELKAGIRAWLAAGIPGAVLLMLSARRCRQYWPCLSAGWTSKGAWQLPEKMDLDTAASFAGLFCLGALCGYLTVIGFVAVMALLAVGSSAIPWWKIAIVQRSVALACLAVASGAIAAVLVGHRPVWWVFYAFAAWAFFLIAAASAMSAAWRSTPASRAVRAAPVQRL